MSTAIAGHDATWSQLDRTDQADRRERSRLPSQHREASRWSMASPIRSFFAVIWLALYSILGVGTALAGIVLTILAIPILIFGPLFLVGVLLQAATRVFQGFGLV